MARNASTALRGATRSPVLAVAALLTLAWLAVDPRTPDLAAQVYRAGLFSREGFALWDANWYGGHHLPGYSLLFPPLADVLGARVVGALSAVASALAFERLAREHFGDRRARLGAVWFAAAAAGDLLIGRLTYGLGVAIGLGALLALRRGRPRLAAALAAACAAASPVAGLFLVLAGTALIAGERRARGLVLAAPALACVLALAVAFPEGGRQPFAWGALHVVLLCSLAVGVLVPREERVLRAGAALYALAGLAAYALPTPMGANVSRLGAVVAGPVLLCAISGRRPSLPGGRAIAGVALAGLALWQWWAPVREVGKGAEDPSTQAAYYAGLAGFLRGHLVDGRLEVPFTRAHWEAVYLARRFALARGWETQLDTKYNALFYDRRRPLPPVAYRHWLERNGVRYVALPDVPLDPSGRAEARLIATGPAFLRPVWSDRHWRVFAVSGAHGLVHGPARLVRLAETSFTVRARRAGRVLVRVRWTPYWRVSAGAACAAPAGGGWTRLVVRRPGTVRVTARLSAAGLLREVPACGGALAAAGGRG